MRMRLIMANRTQSYEVVSRVRATTRVLMYVMQLQVARIRPVPKVVPPSATLAGMIVAEQDSSSYRVRNGSVMFWTLAQ